MRYNNKNYIDFIDKNTSIIPKLSNNDFDFKNNTIILPKRINLSNIDNINKIFKKNFKNLNKLLCLDFHGVVDLYDNNEIIPSELDKCIISYIGGNINTFGNTINSIISRIQSNEIKLGILVYNKNKILIEGTKGWFVKNIREILPNLEIYFIDDSIINIKCINKIKDNKIHLYYINKYKQPLIKLNNLLLKINSL